MRGAGSSACGSSPLTRGKLISFPHHLGVRGLIPAHAGKTLSRKSRADRSQAHPRSRGENTNRPCQVAHVTGSSPLTRGKPVAVALAFFIAGLIPAHAGKTRPQGPGRHQGGAHPRSRGENAAEETAVDIHLGSSPLTRGKRPAHLLRLHKVGLIPAHAGKTLVYWAAHQMGRAHPRSRGENPRGRSADHSPLWLIPAHAGKTRRNHLATMRHWAHPRSRGENS